MPLSDAASKVRDMMSSEEHDVGWVVEFGPRPTIRIASSNRELIEAIDGLLFACLREAKPTVKEYRKK